MLVAKWHLTTAKLYEFTGLMYARGAYEAKNRNMPLLWNDKWDPAFFSNTTSRNDFTEGLLGNDWVLITKINKANA